MKKIVVLIVLSLSFSLFASEKSAVSQTEKQENVVRKSWVDYVKPSIDFRYRHEIIADDGKDTRQRERIRIRAGVVVSPLKALHIGFGIVSGNDSPTSGDQTLGESFSSKPIRINRAYASWTPVLDMYAVELTAGKFDNNFVRVAKNTLIWDSDLTFEGFAFNNNLKKGLFRGSLNFGFDWIEERKNAKDSFLAGAQLVLGAKAAKWYARFGGSFFYFTEAKGNPVFYDATKSYGNSTSVDAIGINHYLFDYQEVEAFGEVGMTVKMFSFALFGDFVANTAPDVSERFGYLAGLKTSAKITKKQSITFVYDYRSLERDAVVGSLADTGFNGSGLGGSAHRFEISYRIPFVKFGATYHYGQNSLTTRSDFHKVQLDVTVSYR